MPVPQQGSKFDMRLNPVYQIDWFSQATGKRIAQTKRKVQFNFGFSNPEAIRNGETGPDCRGEEHQVELIWSITSGKRIVTFDGKEVHYSKGKAFSETKFEACWSMEGNHQLKLIAHAVTPLVDTPGFRQFDLILDGMSFFDMTHIYELGRKQQLAGFVKTPRVATPRKAIQYDADHSPSHDSLSTVPTVDSYEPNPVSPSSKTTVASVPVPDLLEAMTVQQDYLAPTTPAITDSPAVHDRFTPIEVTPTFESVSNQILNAYPPTAPTMQQFPQLTYDYSSPYQQPLYHQPPPSQYQTQEWQPQAPSQYYGYNETQYAAREEEASPAKVAPLTLSMAPLSIEDFDERSSSPTSPMDKALNALVNFDDIKETKESPEQRKYQQSKQSKLRPKSKPLPPAKSDWTLGLQPKLGEIKEHAPEKAARTTEIMRTHAFDPRAAQAGMMVVYGSPVTMAQPSYYHGYQQQPMMHAGY